MQYITQPPDFTGFNDPAKGKEIAAVDVRGRRRRDLRGGRRVGLGVFEAAAEAGEPGEVWAIGVDSDQYNLVDAGAAAVHPHVDAEEGRRRRVRHHRGVGRRRVPSADRRTSTSPPAVSTTPPSGGFVDDIADQLDEYKEQIIDGEIEVPTTP